MQCKTHPTVKEMQERFQIGFSQDIIFTGGIKVTIDEDEGVIVYGPERELERYNMASLQGNPLECLVAILSAIRTGSSSNADLKAEKYREWVASHIIEGSGDALRVIMHIEASSGHSFPIEEWLELPPEAQLSGSTSYYGEKSSQQSLVIELEGEDADYDTQLEYADGEIRFDEWNRYSHEEEE